MAIGHVRYSTTGGGSWENAQPVWRDDGRELALAHNGNLTNAVELWNELKESGHRLPRHLRLGDHRRAALLQRRPLHRGRGRRRDAAARGRLLDRGDDQARDRRLPRPARGAAALARAARRPLRRRLRELRLRHHRRRAAARGAPRRDGLADRARAGDAPGGASRRPPRHCVFEHIYFSRPDSRLEGKVLQQVRGRMGEILWREAPVEADLVISVPDSGNPAAAGFARASGLPRDDGLIKNRYVARTFIQPGQELRKRGLRLKFNPLPEIVAGQRIVVVDDSIVRGNTTRQIVGMLRDAGAKRGPPADLGAADPPPLPLRGRHVDPRGDDRPQAHGRGDRRRARRRLPRLPLDGGRLRGDRHAARGPLRRLLHRPLPARRPRRGERQIRPRGHRRGPGQRA